MIKNSPQICKKTAEKNNQELIINYDEIADLELKYKKYEPVFANLKKNAIVI